jgi:hypothetical protein
MPQLASISGAAVLTTIGHAVEVNSFRVDRFSGKGPRTTTLESITDRSPGRSIADEESKHALDDRLQ